MRFLSVCLLGLVCFSGCESDSEFIARLKQENEKIQSTNTASLASGGEQIGTLPDGRTVTRYEVQVPGRIHPHYIYVVPDSGSITKNSETGGKGSYNSVQAEISQ